MLNDQFSDSYISVCEEKCLFQNTSSSATSAKCLLPPVSTVYSNKEFGIKVPQKLKGFDVTTSSQAYAHMLFDGNIFETYFHTGLTCHITMSFKPGYKGVLSKVKTFFGGKLPWSIYTDNLSFEGSNDGTTWTNLYTVDENTHTGWNYQEWTENLPTYSKYRFFGNSRQACKLNEIELWGIETIDDTAAGLTCTAKVVVNG